MLDSSRPATARALRPRRGSRVAGAAALLALTGSLLAGCSGDDESTSDASSGEAGSSDAGGSGGDPTECPFDFDVSALEEAFADMPYRFERKIEEGESRECLWVWDDDWLLSDEVGKTQLMGDQIAYYVYVTPEPVVEPPVIESVEAGGYTVGISDAPPFAEGASLQTDDGTWVILTVAVPSDDFEFPRDAMVETAVAVADGL